MPKTIKLGDTGTTVKLLQERLNTRGFGPLSLDGDFGPKTDAAVDTFQASEGLAVDGIVGPNTWDRLMVEERAEVPQNTLEEQRSALFSEVPPDVTGERLRALGIACAALGLKESPQGSNGGPEIHRFVGGYNDYWQTGMTALMAWCGMFVAACIAFAHGCSPNPSWGDWSPSPLFNVRTKGGAWLGGVKQLEEWAKASGRWSTDLSEIPSGALVTMGREGSGSDAGGGSHVYMVVVDRGSELLTVEGNVSDAVGSHERPKDGRIRGWIKWW